MTVHMAAVRLRGRSGHIAGARTGWSKKEDDPLPAPFFFHSFSLLAVELKQSTFHRLLNLSKKMETNILAPRMHQCFLFFPGDLQENMFFSLRKQISWFSPLSESSREKQKGKQEERTRDEIACVTSVSKFRAMDWSRRSWSVFYNSMNIFMGFRQSHLGSEDWWMDERGQAL